MSKEIPVRWIAVCGIAVLLATDVSFAQAPASNPYRPVRGLADGGGPSVPGGEWARLPGREMGPPASVHVDVDGESIWAFIRCVVTAPNGDIFVADGHFTNNRIVKYSKDGKFIKAWGKTGYAPGEFRVPHCIAMDKRGRLFVCDRSNARIQIFDQDGKFLARWYQFGMPSGIAFSINEEDLIYVFDSESDNVDNPGFEQGIRIGDAQNGWVRDFILDQGGNPNVRTGSAPEFGTVDKFGNVFAGEPRRRVLRKYVKVR